MRLSILIPKSTDLAAFEDTLASVLANRPAKADVIVLCPGGYDDPYQLGGEVRFLATPPEEPLPTTVNRILPDLAGEIVHIISCGLRVGEGWSDAAATLFSDHEVGAITPLIVTAGRNRLAAVGVCRGLTGGRRLVGVGRRVTRRTSRLSAAGPTLQAAFYSHTALTKLGGFDESMGPWLADLDLALTMRRAGYRCPVAVDCRLTSAGGVVSDTSGFEAGRLSEQLFWKHWQSWPDLVLHPLTVLADTVHAALRRRGISTFAGHLLGAFQRVERLRAPAKDLVLAAPGADDFSDVHPLEQRPAA